MPAATVQPPKSAAPKDAEPHLSASQLRTYAACSLQWWFQSRLPDTVATEASENCPTHLTEGVGVCGWNALAEQHKASPTQVSGEHLLFVTLPAYQRGLLIGFVPFHTLKSGLVLRCAPEKRVVFNERNGHQTTSLSLTGSSLFHTTMAELHTAMSGCSIFGTGPS
jgi:hypothetical protein